MSNLGFRNGTFVYLGEKMIETIKFENYKAFREGEFKLKPLTVFLGPNSVGKSSLMQLILLLQQTAFSDLNYKSPLALNGNFVSLGEDLNLIKNKKTGGNLIIKLECKNTLFKTVKN